MERHKSFYLISLGCPKNLVNSAGLATLLERAGYVAAATAGQADVLIVNTCGFIAPAREESLDVLRELAQSKRPGQRLIAAGCYAERSPQELAAALPDVDGFIGTRRWAEIVPFISQMGISPLPPFVGGSRGEGAPDVPHVAIQGASAYLQIADGCDHACAFCAIPLIKGRAVSRPPTAILADARWLAGRGVQEIILIAQDTTAYGRDLGLHEGLAGLLEQLMATVPEVPWLRLMYAYPGRITQRLIETMARHPQVLPYLDLPLQHAHPDVLRRMRRPADVEKTQHTIERLRAAMPDIVIRTTFIVGFPGEGEAEFQTLLDFMAEVQFDRVGVFTYSHEEGTPAAWLADDVPPEVKEERRERLMAAQQPISLAKNRALVGQTLDVLIEGQEEGLSVGRSKRDAPEVDGLVLAQANLPVGRIVPLRITGALEYDLVGEPVRR